MKQTFFSVGTREFGGRLLHFNSRAPCSRFKSITEEILDLKRQRRAMILAHHYQDSEIQEIADAIGDSLELSRGPQNFDGDVIAFCGVVFMAETAKVLNPSRMVVLPDLDAGCSLVDGCPAAQVRAFRERHPDHVDRQLHQYLGRGESRKRHSVHLAQRGQDRELDSARRSRSCSCPISIWAIT